ncbi:DUF2971 domain-containing protein [Brevundimonas sp.]|uniref:DUF2971 domain-containing protein n=1 Tax=Brevundimonas sp. TaxID=1871086 RepID=UPI003D128EDC
MTAPIARIVLANRRLRWSTPRTFNDPFDVQFDLRMVIDRAQIRRLTLQKMWDDLYGAEPGPPANQVGVIMRYMRGRMPAWNIEQLEDNMGDALDKSLDGGDAAWLRFQLEAREQLKNSKILCLTTAPENFLMWTHYAGQHTGAVLGFRNAPGLDSPWGEARPVNYVDQMPALIDDEEFSNVLAGRANLEASAVIDKLVYTKSDAFAYEQERRIYSGDGRNAEADFEDLEFHENELDSVTLGPRILPEDEDAIRGLVAASYGQVEMRRAILEPNRFGIRIIPA